MFVLLNIFNCSVRLKIQFISECSIRMASLVPFQKFLEILQIKKKKVFEKSKLFKKWQKYLKTHDIKI